MRGTRVSQEAVVRRRGWATLGCLLLLGGCEDPGAIRVYSVQKQAPGAAPAQGPHAGQGVVPQGPVDAGGEGPLLLWDLPPGWKVGSEQKPMRWATLVTDVGGPGQGPLEVAISRFPGDVGGPLANVNRWRGQVGLPPAGQAELGELLRPVEGARLPVSVVDLAGSEERLLAAMVAGGGETWFLKLQGPTAQVAPAVEGFQALVRSLRFGADPHAGHDHPPGMHGAPPQGPAPQGPGEASGLPFSFTAPGEWTSTPPSGPRLLGFKAGSAELSVTSFPGDVGGGLANLNRWRQQVGLAPVDALPEGAFAPALVGRLAAQQVELAGPEKALLVALVPRQGVTWFFKLAGDPAGVQAERERFGRFLESVQWEGAR